MINFTDELKKLKNRKVIIVAHESPDGDGIGATIAMTYFLGSIGALPYPLNKDEISEKYDYIVKNTNFKTIADVNTKELKDVEDIIVVDSGNINRIGFELKDYFPNIKRIFNIDHHISNEKFGLFNRVEIISSTCELIANIFVEGKVKMNKEAATALFTGIMTDTGNLTFSSVTSKTFSIISYLSDRGADRNLFRKKVYESQPLRKIEGIKEVLNNLKLKAKGLIGYSFISSEKLNELGLKSTDMEGLIDYPRSIDSVKISILFREHKKGLVKISIRTDMEYDSNIIARAFGGGGHVRAAGCTVKGDLESQIKIVLLTIERGLKDGKWTDKRL